MPKRTIEVDSQCLSISRAPYSNLRLVSAALRCYATDLSSSQMPAGLATHPPRPGPCPPARPSCHAVRRSSTRPRPRNSPLPRSPSLGSPSARHPIGLYTWSSAHTLTAKTRSSATAKSTARPSYLVGVLYDIYRETNNRSTANQPLVRNWPWNLPNSAK